MTCSECQWNMVFKMEYTWSKIDSKWLSKNICDSIWKTNGWHDGFSDCQEEMWLKMEIRWKTIGF
jgi:hypothetical protein